MYESLQKLKYKYAYNGNYFVINYQNMCGYIYYMWRANEQWAYTRAHNTRYSMYSILNMVNCIQLSLAPTFSPFLF